MSHAALSSVAGFRPFEYMAWAKRVAPGAAFPMHVSGLRGPAPSVELPVPTVAEWLAPSGPLREEFGRRLAALLGAPERAVTAANGASEAMFLALGPFVERGQPVIVEQPAYRAMERVVEFLGGVPVHIERRRDDRWRLDPERLDALLVETGARVIGITDPHNPTGISIDAGTRAALLKVVERRGALLVVDEVFALFRGVHRLPVWTAGSENVLSLGSLTKGWGLSSLRTGWVLGPPALVERCRQLFDLLGVNPPTGTLVIALGALAAAEQLDAIALAASRRANEVFAATDWGEADMVPPQDGIIGFLRMAPGWTSDAAAETLRRLDGVQIVPGHFFGCDDHLRIGVAGDGFDPIEGCRRIAARLNGGRPV